MRRQNGENCQWDDSMVVNGIKKTEFLKRNVVKVSTAKKKKKCAVFSMKQFGTEQAMISWTSDAPTCETFKCLYMYTLRFNHSSSNQSCVRI